ncbi:MAG TPA: malto-oligosyltrehalose synthase [Nitrospirota bacterium]
MDYAEIINRLATLSGICHEYMDIWGNRHEPSQDAKAAILKALGYRLDDAESTERSLAHAEEKPWRAVMRPAHVVTESAEVELGICLPDRLSSEEFSWRLTLEDGKVSSGKFKPAGLRKNDSRTIDGGICSWYVLNLGNRLPLGYHRLDVSGNGLTASTRIVITPAHCYEPPAFSENRRLWGASAQLYSLRSAENWGVGDFGDLEKFCSIWGEQGAGIIGVNPLHALFPHRPDHVSPYSPSSRQFLNPVYLRVERMDDYLECGEAVALASAPEFQVRIQSLRDSSLVDYTGVMRAKLDMLQLLYASFHEKHLGKGTPRAADFLSFKSEAGEPLKLHCIFEAICAYMQSKGLQVLGWQDWPEEYREHTSSKVAEFAREHQYEVDFFAYLQWQTARQLESVKECAQELSLDIGLFQDIAVGVHGQGSEVWSEKELYMGGVEIGSPPDDFNLDGQKWGLLAVSPEKLAESGYEPFRVMLHNAMALSGAVRIDHVMGLYRLFLVPFGMEAADGIYLHYPMDDLMGILALESVRHNCMVIGEDLGTVPEIVRERMREYGILSYRIFFLEQDSSGVYFPPEHYPRDTMVVASTHDLPSLAGYWRGHDLALRKEYNAFPNEEVRERQVLQRAKDRVGILVALEREGLLPVGISSEDPSSVVEMPDELIVSIYTFLARTPALVLTVQAEDSLAEIEQSNLPGTMTDTNWRRKLSCPVDDMRGLPLITRLGAALRRERGGSSIIRKARPLEKIAPEIPRATYRLQFSSEFTFRDARRIIPYLAELGISHIYSSPYLRTRKGSTHGYDIIDHNSLNPDIGSEYDYYRFTRELSHYGMGQLLDIVPNHMAIGKNDNEWWLDVLENGQASTYAGFFDIDWESTNPGIRGKVLLPVLGDQYGNALESGALKLMFDLKTGGFSVGYYAHRFPIDPAGYHLILERGMERLSSQMGRENDLLLEFQSLITAFRNLPPQTERDPQRLMDRGRDKEIYKKQLASLCGRSPDIENFIGTNVFEINGNPEDPSTFDTLDGILGGQAYRLAYWRVASDEINYRRFFDINDLAGLRMENEQVFARTHKLIFRLVHENKVQGLRIDHPDGLYDPLDYLKKLQKRVAQIKSTGSLEPSLAEDSIPDDRKYFYIVAEKILAAHEHVPDTWPVHGTTGYDFCRWVDGIFVDPSSEKKLDSTYSHFIGSRIFFDQLVYEKKRLIMRVALASELNVLSNMLNRISNSDRRTRDFSLIGLRDAIREFVACFPAYRSYISRGDILTEDRRHIDWAINLAKKRSRTADVSVFDFLRDVMLQEHRHKVSEDFRGKVLEFVMKLQQFTGPVTAKGIEDTAFYVYNRLVSLNEVGGDPSRYGNSVQAFHHSNQERSRRWPHSMLLTSSHDTKRGEDMRMRINVLSELPNEWREKVYLWSRINSHRKTEVDGEPAPSRNDEYLLYQTLIGTWPRQTDEAGTAALCARVEEYILKAAREAKVHMSWVNPNLAYEEALVGFVRALLDTSVINPFLEDFRPFVRKVTRYGLFNSLSQSFLKFMSPGVPDTYQGCELWNFSLVDPDNRRPVDYQTRVVMMDELKRGFTGGPTPEFARSMLDSMEDGQIKLYLIWRCLAVRKELEPLFLDSDYARLAVEGQNESFICAFARCLLDKAVVAVAPRLFTGLTGESGLPIGDIWRDTFVEAPFDGERIYTNIFTGATLNSFRRGDKYFISLEEVLADFPVAALTCI